ncbi:MAG: fructosamine kinase, partial [Propionibacteriaceae bacterium]|nr:fructosamine kinase [Propionibacteriaceae bacterium]
MDLFVKRRSNAPVGLFAAEAAGLAWLKVPGGASIVEVVDQTSDSITLRRVATVAPRPEAAERFGRELAWTHDAGAAGFGAPPDGFRGQCFIADLAMSTCSQ